ncbi:hypothetical protein MTO96_013103 [Rhipicephalus appendiculatus]
MFNDVRAQESPRYEHDSVPEMKKGLAMCSLGKPLAQEEAQFGFSRFVPEHSPCARRTQARPCEPLTASSALPAATTSTVRMHDACTTPTGPSWWCLSAQHARHRVDGGAHLSRLYDRHRRY